MWVVKLGGSLAESPFLIGWLEHLSQTQAVIVPGGGPFAESVRKTQAVWHFDELTAHHMAILGMRQFGRMLVGLCPRLLAATELDDFCEQRCRAKVWLPSPETLDSEGIPATWDITSDSLAVWLAGKLKAEHLLLVKSVAEFDQQTDCRLEIAQAQAVGWVDPLFGHYATGQSLQSWLCGPKGYASLPQAFNKPARFFISLCQNINVERAMTNPLLESYDLPLFSSIKPEHAVPAITQILADNRNTIAEMLKPDKTYTWANLVEPLEGLEDRLNKAFSPVSHLNSVVNSDELREAYNACLPLLTDYATEYGQNEDLYHAFRALASGTEYSSLTEAQRKVIDNALRDFRLSGVALPPESKERFKVIALELSRLASQFQDNLLDATNGWSKHIENESLLAGIPESARVAAYERAEREGKVGWVFNLEFPSYFAVITYADDRELRREFYTAYATRASDQGPAAGRWDNTGLMENILALRHEEAQLLGFANFAELSLATKMARSTDEVIHFLEDLSRRSLPVARRDLDDLRTYALTCHGLEDIESWDLGYYSEKLREQAYSLSEEEIKLYFPATKVVPGMFQVVDRLYGLKIREVDGADVWHKDVKFYEIRDRDDAIRGYFYLDLYARPKKQGGAWMDDCVSRCRINGKFQLPVAYLTCNFTPPTVDAPALLRHPEVLTLFHEFGHGLHHMLTRIDYLSVSGIHGVQWDAVELPSQFMENFCWEKEALALISGHYLTGQALPESLFNKMLAARNFQAGMQMVRQLELSLFDFRVHLDYDPAQGGRIYPILDQVRRQTAVFIPPDFNRFAHSFSHIFSGGYGAGYYSYKWAEVLSSDAFSLFEEHGVFDALTGQAFLEKVLERGGSRDAMELFVEFRGREPEIDALLRHNGIIQTSNIA